MTASENTGAQGRYTQLTSDRDVFLRRARACAKLTVPSLLPEEGHSKSNEFLTPRQSLGARGLNNLASKLVLALLPPNSPFFKHAITDEVMRQLGAEQEQQSLVEKALASIEREVMTEIEIRALRTTIHEALKQLIMAGNVLIHINEDGTQRIFKLDRFVVHRDPSGNVLEIITEEEVAPMMLPEEVQQRSEEAKRSANPEKTAKVYTQIKREDSRWFVHQEVYGKAIPGSEGTYPLDKLPWLCLRWSRIDGEDYGRGYIEEYFGDLQALEGLSDSIIKGAAAAARVVPLVNPNGMTDIDELAEAEDGDFVSGLRDDVGFLQVDKFGDFRVAQEMVRDLTERLSFAFMLNTAIQRNGERVTAEEIRYMAGELEDALGGVYSILSQELQLPLVQVLTAQLERSNRLPALPKGVVRPTITTGLEALGRGHDLTKLDTFLAGLQQTLGPEVVSQWLNVGDYITRRGTALGIDTDGLVRSAEEVQQAQQAAQMQQLVQQLGPNVINALGRQGAAEEGQPDG